MNEEKKIIINFVIKTTERDRGKRLAKEMSDENIKTLLQLYHTMVHVKLLNFINYSDTKLINKKLKLQKVF